MTRFGVAVVLACFAGPTLGHADALGDDIASLLQRVCLPAALPGGAPNTEGIHVIREDLAADLTTGLTVTWNEASCGVILLEHDGNPETYAPTVETVGAWAATVVVSPVVDNRWGGERVSLFVVSNADDALNRLGFATAMFPGQSPRFELTWPPGGDEELEVIHAN